jgi:hypothetical protein
MLLAVVGLFMVWAGHDVTDSVRTIVAVGGWIVVALGVTMVALAVAAARSPGGRG